MVIKNMDFASFRRENMSLFFGKGQKFFKIFQSRFFPCVAMTAILPFSGNCQQD
jgi:hypothetical protein